MAALLLECSVLGRMHAMPYRSSGGHRSDGFQVEGRVNPARQNNVVDLYLATAGYFDTLAIAASGGPRFCG